MHDVKSMPGTIDRVVRIAVLAAFAAGGCGPSLSHTVPEDLLQRLPKSSRRSVFQAESVVTIAFDGKGAVKRKRDTTLREIDRIGEKIEDARKRRSGASGDKADEIGLEIEMLKAKRDYLHDVVAHQDIHMKLAAWKLTLAGAQFELAKVRLVKKHSIAFSDSVEDFEAQVEDIKADVNELSREVDAEAAALKLEEEKWLAAKKRYFTRIGESSKGWWTEQ